MKTEHLVMGHQLCNQYWPSLSIVKTTKSEVPEGAITNHHPMNKAQPDTKNTDGLCEEHSEEPLCPPQGSAMTHLQDPVMLVWKLNCRGVHLIRPHRQVS